MKTMPAQKENLSPVESSLPFQKEIQALIVSIEANAEVHFTLVFKTPSPGSPPDILPLDIKNEEDIETLAWINENVPDLKVFVHTLNDTGKTLQERSIIRSR